MFVYTIQPVVKLVWQPVWQRVWQPVVSCVQTFNRSSNRFDDRFDNRLYRVNGAWLFLFVRSSEPRIDVRTRRLQSAWWWWRTYAGSSTQSSTSHNTMCSEARWSASCAELRPSSADSLRHRPLANTAVSNDYYMGCILRTILPEDYNSPGDISPGIPITGRQTTAAWLYITVHTLSGENGTTPFLPLTLPNANRFSKLFHRQTWR